jgi:hypothetical protein
MAWKHPLSLNDGFQAEDGLFQDRGQFFAINNRRAPPAKPNTSQKDNIRCGSICDIAAFSG